MKLREKIVWAVCIIIALLFVIFVDPFGAP